MQRFPRVRLRHAVTCPERVRLRTYVTQKNVCPLPPGVKDQRLHEPPFSDRPMRYIVDRHAQRAHLAYQTSLAEAERLGRRLYVVTACDHVKGVPSGSLSEELRAKLQQS